MWKSHTRHGTRMYKNTRMYSTEFGVRDGITGCETQVVFKDHHFLSDSGHPSIGIDYRTHPNLLPVSGNFQCDAEMTFLVMPGHAKTL